MQIKKAGFLTKLVVLTLLVASVVSLLGLQGNADLRDAIDHSSDPDRQAAIARSELNLAAPGEKVIIFTD